MSIQGEVIPMFFVPLYTGKVEITPEEQRCVTDQLKYERNGWGGNDISSNKHLHQVDHPLLQSLHNKILDHIRNLLYNHLKIGEDLVRPLLIGSWALKCHPGEQQLRHSHPGCIFSGVLYIKCLPNCGDIVFSEPYKGMNFLDDTFQCGVSQLTELTQTEKSWAPSTGDIVIFKSEIDHHVTPNDSNDIRYSLAFDAWLDGDFSNPMHDKYVAVTSNKDYAR